MKTYAVTSFETARPTNPTTFTTTLHTTHNAIWALHSQLVNDLGYTARPLISRPEYRDIEKITADQCVPGSTHEHLMYKWDFNDCTYMVTEV